MALGITHIHGIWPSNKWWFHGTSWDEKKRCVMKSVFSNGGIHLNHPTSIHTTMVTTGDPPFKKNYGLVWKWWITPPPFILEESLRLCHSGDLGDFLIDGPVDFVGVPRFFLQGNFANAWSLDASDPKKWEYNDITKKFGPFYMFNLWPRVEQRKLILAKKFFLKKKT